MTLTASQIETTANTITDKTTKRKPKGLKKKEDMVKMKKQKSDGI